MIGGSAEAVVREGELAELAHSIGTRGDNFADWVVSGLGKNRRISSRRPSAGPCLDMAD